MRKRCAQKAGRQPPYGTATKKFGATLKKQDAFVTELRTGFFQRQATFFKKRPLTEGIPRHTGRTEYEKSRLSPHPRKKPDGGTNSLPYRFYI